MQEEEGETGKGDSKRERKKKEVRGAARAKKDLVLWRKGDSGVRGVVRLLFAPPLQCNVLEEMAFWQSKERRGKKNGVASVGQEERT